jgi:hypothetical protein
LNKKCFFTNGVDTHRYGPDMQTPIKDARSSLKGFVNSKHECAFAHKELNNSVRRRAERQRIDAMFHRENRSYRDIAVTLLDAELQEVSQPIGEALGCDDAKLAPNASFEWGNKLHPLGIQVSNDDIVIVELEKVQSSLGYFERRKIDASNILVHLIRTVQEYSKKIFADSVVDFSDLSSSRSMRFST